MPIRAFYGHMAMFRPNATNTKRGAHRVSGRVSIPPRHKRPREAEKGFLVLVNLGSLPVTILDDALESMSESTDIWQDRDIGVKIADCSFDAPASLPKLRRALGVIGRLSVHGVTFDGAEPENNASLAQPALRELTIGNCKGANLDSWGIHREGTQLETLSVVSMDLGRSIEAWLPVSRLSAIELDGVDMGENSVAGILRSCFFGELSNFCTVLALNRVPITSGVLRSLEEGGQWTDSERFHGLTRLSLRGSLDDLGEDDFAQLLAPFLARQRAGSGVKTPFVVDISDAAAMPSLRVFRVATPPIALVAQNMERQVTCEGLVGTSRDPFPAKIVSLDLGGNELSTAAIKALARYVNNPPDTVGQVDFLGLRDTEITEAAREQGLLLGVHEIISRRIIPRVANGAVDLAGSELRPGPS